MLASETAVKKARGRNQVPSGIPAPDPYDAKCPTRLLLDRIADKWSVLLLGRLRERTMRFNELRRCIEGLTQKMLSAALKALERDGLVSRHVRPTSPVTVEYAITPLGATLAAMLDPLQHWAREHISEVIAAQRRYDGKNPPAPDLIPIAARRRTAKERRATLT